MRTGRNNPCYCGSGRTYKFCHLPIDDALTEDKYAAAQKVYAKHWSRTSELHFDERLYHWMAERLSPFAPSKIFDVGCGSGHGLIALFETFGREIQVVSVEENASCVTIAENTLAMTGVPTKKILRLEVFHSGSGYFFKAGPVPTPFRSGCTLIEGDVCNDPRLIEALLASERFDAVTVWLSGTHMMRPQHADIQRNNIKSDGSHRLYVQNSTYDLAERILRPGGVLQVVDRTEVPDTDLMRDDMLDAHREQASTTSLKVMSLDYLRYKEPAESRMPMKITPGLSGRMPDRPDIAITSVISQKPD